VPSFRLEVALEAAILSAFDGSRTRLPAPGGVRARRNVSRLASFSTPRGEGGVLNLSTAVVDAGPEAWRLVAPALEGDPASRARLRTLAEPGLRENRRARRRRDEAPSGVPSPLGRSLPRTSCQGTPEQRAFLRTLLGAALARASRFETMPLRLQLRISRRMTSRLGTFAHGGADRRITIAERLFRPGLEEIVWETVKHEVAHLADQATSPTGGTSHGPSWRTWARRIGARPDRLCSSAELLRIEAAGRRAGPLVLPPDVAGESSGAGAETVRAS
jgi:hypothetical protein